MREREKVREREAKEDAQDRAQEQRELASSQQKQRDHARGQADAFLDQQADELSQARSHREPQHFKISLGAAAKKLETAAAPRRTAADVENLLEDEDTSSATGKHKRALIPINFDAAVRANLTQEEIEDAQRQLARDIPKTRRGCGSGRSAGSIFPRGTSIRSSRTGRRTRCSSSWDCRRRCWWMLLWSI